MIAEIENEKTPEDNLIVIVALIKHKLLLKWTWGVPAIGQMSCPISSVSDGKTAYFRKCDRSRSIVSFESGRECWNALPHLECLVEDTPLFFCLLLVLHLQ